MALSERKRKWQRHNRATKRHSSLCVICARPSRGKYHCKSCAEKHNARERSSKWWLTAHGRQRQREAVKKYRQRLRKKVIMAYGGQCSCCGEDEYLFLELDHVNNDGSIERGRHRSLTPRAFNSIIKRNYPDCYRVLCSNCNQGRHLNGGICPHVSKQLPNLMPWEIIDPAEEVIN